jgi:hypothetical protein
MNRARLLSEPGDIVLFELAAQIPDEGAAMTLMGLHERGIDISGDLRTLPFSAPRVNRVVRALMDGTRGAAVGARWLSAVATRVATARPDLAPAILSVLGVEPEDEDHLEGLTIGEVGVCYEALLSELDRDGRKSAGQFFTPDDTAAFMATQSARFGSGVWLDPCCGIGNLAWHLANVQEKPALFVKNQLVLMDRDTTALKSAIALVAADFLADGDEDGVRALAARSKRRDFLSRQSLPKHDYTIVNPPYARAAAMPGYETAQCHDLFAYFMERVAKGSRGYVAVTPASYLSAPKFSPLRSVLDRENAGGTVFVFDNVPDTLFRGYKYGSNNTSKTNFVRAAITVCAPGDEHWSLTPILRWQAADRERMFASCESLLVARKIGPHGEWTKIHPGFESVWEMLLAEPHTLKDLVTSEKTQYTLDVGLTPRYFISATFRSLDRGSKATLCFQSEEDRDKAALVLNSSLPYLWWRGLDGGVTLPRRVLLSVPIPSKVTVQPEFIAQLLASESANLVTKLNAGRENENVKHPPSFVRSLNKEVLPDSPDLAIISASSMFPAVE